MVVGWILGNKIACLFVVATTAFCISTIVLGVQNADLKDEVDELKAQIAATTLPPVTTPAPTIPPITEPPTTEPPTTEPPEEDMTDYRLPTNVIPSAYDLYLTPDLSTGLFTGETTITIDVLEENVGTVKLHNNGLTITSVSIDGNSCTYTLDATHELLVITPTSPLSAGESILEINFAGDMKNRIVGLYVSSYQDESGDDRYMATSKFEPTYARQAYPCFDEPNMKASFTVHLVKPADDDYIALSNMPEEPETEVVPGGVLVHFQESVKMSTYLSCFIVSDFKYTSVTFGEDNQQLRVFATPAQLEKTVYARDTAKKVIEYFIEYFGIKFPLPKLDLAAIPDFVSGAMEHWGLVTFRETALLYSEEISSSANKQRIATVVSHELAHSWFGNLVTMDWWNDLWLNEGFASYIEYKGVDAAEDGWDMMAQFLIADLHPVLIVDAKISSHPIVQTVLTPNEITAIFDTISYNKGAAILRMLEDVVGDEHFREGVTKYLNNHLYGNAVTQDLWNALQEVSEYEKSITEIMNTWTIQMGYPVVNVRRDGDYYVLTQTRYLTDPDAVDTTETPYDYKWTIPITYITSTDVSTPQRIWFDITDSEIRIPVPADATWIKFNYHQVGYYRVQYEDEEWENLNEHLIGLDVADRAHLLEEAFRLAESGHVTYEIPLNMTMYLKEERHYIPWSIANTMLSQLKLYLANSLVLSDFQEYVIDALSNAYDELGWNEVDTDEHLKRRARVELLDLACNMGHEECLNQASELFNEWLTSGTALSQDLRTLVYNYGMASSSSSSWDILYDRFIAESDATEKLKLMNGLAQVRDTTLLTKFIEIAKTDDVVRSQDYFTLLAYISANPVGTNIVWDYVRENWEALVDRFGLNERYLGTMIPSITRRFTTQTKLEEMQAFFAKYPDAGAGATARVQALETVQNNIKWVTKYKIITEDWITKYTEEK